MENGRVLHGAFMGYRTWGSLDASGSNAIILPSYYSGTCDSYAPWVEEGPSRIFDPSRYCVIAYDQLGAGHSSKPSACGGFDAWPGVTCADSVRAAHRMLQALGIHNAQLVMGWSMGGMQAFAWASLFPGFARSALALCATPACEPINQVFLRSIRPMLDMAVREGSTGARWDALKAFGSAYAGWAYSPEFFNTAEYEQLGYSSVQNVMDGWAQDHACMDAQDLLAQLDCWLNSSTPLQKDAASPTQMLAMPCSTDRYFPAESRSAEELFRNCRTQVLESTLGHIAGRPGIREQETRVIRAAALQLLDKPGH